MKPSVPYELDKLKDFIPSQAWCGKKGKLAGAEKAFYERQTTQRRPADDRRFVTVEEVSFSPCPHRALRLSLGSDARKVPCTRMT